MIKNMQNGRKKVSGFPPLAVEDPYHRAEYDLHACSSESINPSNYGGLTDPGSIFRSIRKPALMLPIIHIP